MTSFVLQLKNHTRTQNSKWCYLHLHLCGELKHRALEGSKEEKKRVTVIFKADRYFSSV